MRAVFVFPGQGSQTVGMGSYFFDSYGIVKKTVAEACEILDMPLWDLITRGPAEELNLTVNTQPAMLAMDVAYFRLLEEEGIEPWAVAGHSLGEYAALVAAKSLDFTSALKLVRTRARLMEDAVPAGQGGMAAVLGLDRETVEDCCRRAQAVGIVEAVNYNCPGQIVLAGEKKALEHALALAGEAGARQCVVLKVSGPFHSRLMKPCGDYLTVELAAACVNDPVLPLVANVTAGYARTAGEVLKALTAQVYSPVRWEESMRRLIDDGADCFVEVGPGRVLSGMIKKIDRKMPVFNLEDDLAWQKVLAHFKGVV